MRTIEDYEKAFEDAKAKAREDGGKAAYEARARLMNQYTTGVEPKRVKEIMEAERDGRCVVLPKVPKADKDLMSAPHWGTPKKLKPPLRPLQPPVILKGTGQTHSPYHGSQLT